MRRICVVLLVGLFGLAASFATSGPVTADAGDSVIVLPKWFHVVSKAGKELRINLSVHNRGTTAVAFSLEWLQTPGPDWGVEIRGPLTSFEVRGVTLGPNDQRSLPIEFKVPSDAPPADYKFILKAVSTNGDFEKTITMTITVEGEKEIGPIVREIGKVELEAPKYTSLSGTNESDFEFNVLIRNGTDEPVELDLGGRTPAGWNMSLMPSFKRDKQITSLSLDAGANETVTVQVKPASEEDPGTYGIEFAIRGEGVALSTIFEIAIIGSTGLIIGVPAGGLTAEVAAGDTAPVSILVSNSGSLLLSSVGLRSKAPETWETTFDPDVLTFLARDEIRDVVAHIQPPQNTASGDYRVTLVAASEGLTDSVDVLITVTQPGIGGWVVLGVGALLLMAIFGLFWRLGRR